MKLNAITAAKQPLKSNKYLRILIPLLLLGSIILIFGMLKPAYVSFGNILNLLSEFSMVGLVSIGMAIVLSAGQVDLSIGHIAGISAVVTSLLLVRGVSTFLSILVGIGTSTVFGILNGFLTAYLGVSSFIGSLGTMFIIVGVRYWLTGGATIMCLPSSYTALGKMPYPLIFLIGAFLLAFFLMDTTALGRRLYLIGENLDASELCGIRIRQETFIVFIFSAVFGAFAGEILAARQGLANVDIGDRFMMEAFIAANLGRVLSGERLVALGALFGSALLVFLIGGLTMLGVDPSWLNFIKGSVFLATLIGSIITKRGEEE